MSKLYIYAAIFFVLASLFTWVWSDRYQAGYDAAKAGQLDTHIEADAEDAKKVKEVIKYRDKIRVEYREKIKYIKQANDPTGCLGTPISDLGISGLLNASDP